MLKIKDMIRFTFQKDHSVCWGKNGLEGVSVEKGRQVEDNSHSLGYRERKQHGRREAGCGQIRKIWKKQNLWDKSYFRDKSP